MREVRGANGAVDNSVPAEEVGHHAPMTEAVRIITEQVRLRVRRDGVDLAADNALAEQYVRDEVRRYSERALGGSLPLLADEHQATREVVASLTGFGALQPFLDDPDIEEDRFS